MINMYKGNKFRIYPNKEQQEIITQQIGSCRFVYNKLLETKKTLYDKFKMNISEFDLDKYIPVLKECHPWLKDVHSQALQYECKNLYISYKNFFEGRTKYPKRKSKKDNAQSYQIGQAYKINLDINQIYIPKVGWVKIKLHDELFDFAFFVNNIEVTDKGNIIVEQTKNTKYLKTITISKTPTGKYHVSILTDDLKEAPIKKPFDKSNTIGVDVGVKSFITLSNGETIENPKFLKKSLQKLKHLQRSVSKKVKGSNNRKKAVKLLAKCHEKVANQRHDFQHKISIKLIRENQAIAVEDLNVKGMLQNHKLAQAINDSAWSSFIGKLQYKAEWYGKTILKIGRFEPSSKTCSVCGYHKADLTLDIRKWQCPECQNIHNRDTNAAINIKKFALINHSPLERRKELGDSLTQVRRMNQEAIKSLA